MNKLSTLILLILPLSIFAAKTWNGPSTISVNAWNTAANWLSSGKPGDSEGITFNTAVTITENVPITAGNNLKIQNTFTIANTVTVFNSANISMEAGTFINNGTASAENVTYTNLGGVMTNNNNLTLKNLTLSNSNAAVSFTNNGSLSIIKDIVVFDNAIFDNNPGADVTSEGVDVKDGATVINGGTMTSQGNTSTAKLAINSGGVFINQASGNLTVDYSISNVIAIDVQGTFTNAGTVTIGHTPYNAGARGVKVGSAGIFNNTGNMIFRIDPSECVLDDNTGMNGEFNNDAPITIISGSNCLNSILPILISSLNGQAINNYNMVQWTVETTSPLDAYELQRSVNGSSLWQSIFKNKSNESEQTLNHSYKDFAVTTDSYYRLKLIDQDGEIDYSEIIKIQNKSISNQIRLFPLPASQSIHLAGLIPSEITKLNIVDINGRSIKKLIYDSQTASAEIEINNIPTGLYFLLLSNKEDKTIERLKFIKAN